MAASRFETATYCSEFCTVYKMAGIASFQLSFVKMAEVKVAKSVVAGVLEGNRVDISYSAIVNEIVSLRTSLRKTLVEV